MKFLKKPQPTKNNPQKNPHPNKQKKEAKQTNTSNQTTPAFKSTL